MAGLDRTRIPTFSQSLQNDVRLFKGTQLLQYNHIRVKGSNNLGDWFQVDSSDILVFNCREVPDIPCHYAKFTLFWK